MERRDVLRCGLLGAGALALGFPGRLLAEEEDPAREAGWYEKLPGRQVKCVLCPRECVVADRERGYCGVRENRDGRYLTLVHGRPCAVHSDPIEKKPLFHVLPGTTALSIATAGCNMECRFCQNWEISQFRPEQVRSHSLPPEAVARLAKERGDATIAYTYSEPVVFAEYVRDTARDAKRVGVGSVMISNGFIQEGALRDLVPHLTAVKIDLKAFTETFYEKLCSGRLAPVLRTLEVLKATGTWFEIVFLVIPTKNDDLGDARRMFRWIRERLGPDVPVHLTRFSPRHAYKMKNLPPTPVRTLDALRAIAVEEKLRHVYVGNVAGHPTESTVCAGCGKIVVRRHGYRILKVDVTEGLCGHCERPVPGVWTKSR